MKRCPHCNIEKPLTEFYFRKAAGRYQAWCKACLSESKKASRKRQGLEVERVASRQKWHAMTPEERFFCRISKPSKLGLSRERFYEMWTGVCPICLRDLVLRFGNPVAFVVDHNHQTGEVRGILCNKCNLGIGHLGDRPDACLRAEAYLSA